MTAEELKQVPRLQDRNAVFSALVIIPGTKKRLHDSGYRCMGFVAVDEKSMPMGMMGGGSDVVHIDGIAGLGWRWMERTGGVPGLVAPSGWSIDCLPGSGYLRLWPHGKIRTDGMWLSSFEVFCIREGVEK